MGYLGLIDIISLEEHSKYNFFFQMRTSFTFPLSIVILLAIEEKKAKEQAWKKKIALVGYSNNKGDKSWI